MGWSSSHETVSRCFRSKRGNCGARQAGVVAAKRAVGRRLLERLAVPEASGQRGPRRALSLGPLLAVYAAGAVLSGCGTDSNWQPYGISGRPGL